MEITEEKRQQIIDSIRKWVLGHPFPDKVALEMNTGKKYTPRQILQEVEDDTEFGKLQLRVILYYCERTGEDPTKIFSK